jgi:O-glycosyl hydrolase
MSGLPFVRFNYKRPSHVLLLLSIFLALSACAVPGDSVNAPTLFVDKDPMSSTPQQDPKTVVITIDAQSQAQTIEGFGAAGAWWAQDVGGWEDEKRNLVADLLFDREKGIGLSFYRYNIGGGNGENIQDVWRRAETFEVAPGQYDWTRDANAMWMLRAARDRGVENFVAFVNSPPARMTVSGLTTGEKDGKSNLPPEMYAEYSQYLVDVVRHLRDDENIPVEWISPINEPQWNWSYKNGQEGCHYSPDEVLELTRVLLETLQKNQLDVQLSMFESGEWKSSDVYIEKLASDPQVWDALPHLSIHSYWSTRADKERFMKYMKKNHPDKTLWMSEWTEMQEGRDTGMESALNMASVIHDDLTIANVTSWQYWIAVSKYQYRDGLIYVDPLDHDVMQTKRLWILGNYSRFIRPGFVRMGIRGGDESFLVSAYRSADDQRWVVVAVNLSNQPVNLQLDGFGDPLPARVEQFETSDQSNLMVVDSGTGSTSWTLSPLSVTTLVMDR